jgi:phospholipid transport system substrate-binding protein
LKTVGCGPPTTCPEAGDEREARDDTSRDSYAPPPTMHTGDVRRDTSRSESAMTYRTTMTTLLVTLGLVLGLASDVFAGEPTEFIKKRTAKVVEVLEQKESEKRRTELKETLQKTVDFRELASQALGEHWKARTDEERDQFLDLLQDMLQANYTRKLEGKRLEEENFEVDYQTEKTRGNKAFVRTEVTYEGDAKPVAYKMIKEKDGWIIYDIVIDDVSLLETYRESYTKIIEKEGWAELINKMKAKRKELLAGEKKGNKG